jgi:hypothetical protein
MTLLIYGLDILTIFINYNLEIFKLKWVSTGKHLTQFNAFVINRSEIMRLYQLNVPKDDAWNVMNEFGDVGKA